MTLANLEQFLDKKKRITNSANTVEAYSKALKKWDSFIDTEQLKDKALDYVYEVIDNFVQRMIDESYAPNTIIVYTTVVKEYLKYIKIKLDDEDFSDKVQLPKSRRKNIDRAPEIDEIYAALSITKSLTVKTAIEILASSGMRIGELVNLTVEMIDFRYNRILLPEAITKERIERVVFFSSEAREFLEKYLASRRTGYVFSVDNLGEKHINDNYLSNQITIAFKRTGKNKLLSTRHELHAHTLRKFFYTRAVGIIGEAYAHALLGHSRYLDTYLSLSPEKQYSTYQQIEDSLSIIATVNNNLQVTKKLTKQFDAAIENEKEKASSAVSREEFEAVKAELKKTQELLLAIDTALPQIMEAVKSRKA